MLGLLGFGRLRIGRTDRVDEIVGQTAEMLDDSWAQLLKEWEHLVPNARSRVPSVDVRRVVDKRHVVTDDVGIDGPSVRSNEGPDARSGACGKDAETRGGGATKQPEQDRLCAIVGVVGGGQERRASESCGFVERGVPRLSCPRLEVSARRNLDARARESNLEAIGKRRDPIELACSVATEAMVDAVCHELESERSTKASKHVKQRHRVAAPADGDQHAGAANGARFAFERAARQREERRRMGLRVPAHVGPPRESHTSVSTWLVCGKSSNESIERATYPPAAKVARSRPSVGGSQDT